jgi:hypothetical protein
MSRNRSAKILKKICLITIAHLEEKIGEGFKIFFKSIFIKTGKR